MFSISPPSLPFFSLSLSLFLLLFSCAALSDANLKENRAYSFVLSALKTHSYDVNVQCGGLLALANMLKTGMYTCSSVMLCSLVCNYMCNLPVPKVCKLLYIYIHVYICTRTCHCTSPYNSPRVSTHTCTHLLVHNSKFISIKVSIVISLLLNYL